MTDFLTFEQLLEHLGKFVTKGMTVEQFTSMAMKKGFGPVGQGGLWFNYAAQASSVGSAVTGAGTASQLWASSGALAGASTSTAVVAGSASTTLQAVTSLPTVAEVVTTSGAAQTVTTGAGTIMGVSTSTALAAIAPVLGVSIGVGAYKANPKFWTEASMTLLPFLYDSDDTVASVMIGNGEMYFSEEAINAVADYFKSQGVYNTSLIFPDDVLTSEYIKNLYVTNILPIEPAISVAFTEFQKAIANPNLKPDRKQEARIGLQNLTLAMSDPDFLRVMYDYPDHVKVLSSGLYGFYCPIYLLVFDLKVGDKVKPYNNIIDRAYVGDMRGTAVSNGEMSGRPFYEVTDRGGTYFLLFNGTVQSGAPEDTTIISDNHLPDTTNRKNFVAGVDDDGNLITKPFIPVKLPSSKDGSSTSTKEDSQKPSTDESTLPFLIELINDQKKPKPNPNYNPSADPSQNSASANPPTIPPTIPSYPLKPPTDEGITPPLVLPMSSNADGLITVYNPTKGQISAFGKWLWTTWSGDLLDTITKMFNNPMDAVIGLHLLYATPSTNGINTIKAGFLDSGVESLLVDKQYTQINCGSMIIPEYWKNYLDYAPYTTIHCYLPFIGMVELEPKDVINCAINITYTIDAYSGSCIAQITTAKDDFEAVTYQFSGNCAVQVPMSSGNYSSILSTAIGLTASGLATYATGGAAAPMLAGSTAKMLSTSTNVSHSGAFGASHGAMGIKTPFIEVKCKIQKKVNNYNEDYGYPAFERVTISNCTGFLKVKEVNVVSSTATTQEKLMIEELLKSGVYVD